MKLKTMDIQKFLLTGWYPKMAYNGSGIAEGRDLKDKIFNLTKMPNRITND